MEGGEEEMSVPRFLSTPISHWSVCPAGSQLILTSRLYAHILLAASQDVRSHTRLEGVSSKSGIDQKSLKLWACGWEGPALLGLVMAEPPGPKSSPALAFEKNPWEELQDLCLKYCVTLGKSLNLSEP